MHKEKCPEANNISIHLTLEKHWCELHRSTYAWIFVNRYLYCFFHPCFGVQGCGGSAICRGLEHLQNMVPVRVLEPIPYRYRGTTVKS